jgi:hypothetical protein
MISLVKRLDYGLKDAIGAASRLRTAQPRKRRFITTRVGGFSSVRSVQTHPASCSMGTGALSLRV